jgi:hypothetical protein
MKVLCHNDRQRGRGYLRLVCTDGAGRAPEYSFSICRASDQTFLGRSGWQNTEEKLRPEAGGAEGEAAVLHVGPDISDQLDENENYRLTLFADGFAPQRGTFSVAGINRSLRKSQNTVQGVMPPPLPASPEAETSRQADVQEECVRKEPVRPLPHAAPGKTSKWIAAVIALLLILSGGVFWRHTRPLPLTPEPAENSGVRAEQAPASPRADEPTPAQSGEAGPALTAREQIRQFVNDPQASAQGAMDLYRILSRAPDADKEENQDSVYRLLYFASQKGDAEATYTLARHADPAMPPFGSIPKDGHEAWRLYAAVSGQKPEAVAGMQTLKAWLENEADKGNIFAARWLEAIAKDGAIP